MACMIAWLTFLHGLHKTFYLFMIIYLFMIFFSFLFFIDTLIDPYKYPNVLLENKFKVFILY